MKRLVFVGVLAAFLLGGGYVLYKNRTTSSTDKVAVTASFYPVAEFSRQVGGDLVEVTTMVKPGVEPHDYEPSPSELTKLYRSKLFVYNGAQLERWVDRIKPDLASNHVPAVEASSGIQITDATDGEDAGSPDPHVWLDPVLAVGMVDNIAKAMSQADPIHKATYEKNAAAYKAKLAQLDSDFRVGLAQCSRHDIVTSHAAFAYLAKRYGLNQLPISGLSPDAEPTPQELADIATFAKAHGVTYIFFEDLVSPKLSQTIATEVDAQTISFNPLEGLTAEEVKTGADYLSVQRDNLQSLRTALDCK